MATPPHPRPRAGEAELAGVIRRWYDIAYATAQTPRQRTWVRTAAQAADHAAADAAARDGRPVIHRDGDWFRRAVQAYEHLSATGQPDRPAPDPPAPAAAPAAVPAAGPAPRCAADPATIRAWLASPAGQHPQPTVAQSLGIDEGFHTGSELLSSRMDSLIYTAQYSGVFGLPGHHIELWQVADNEHLVNGHLLTIDRPDRVRLASYHLRPGDLIDRRQRGLDAAVGVLDRVAAITDRLLERAHRPATTTVVGSPPHPTQVAETPLVAGPPPGPAQVAAASFTTPPPTPAAAPIPPPGPSTPPGPSMPPGRAAAADQPGPPRRAPGAGHGR
jgi:hypothetical protein